MAFSSTYFGLIMLFESLFLCNFYTILTLHQSSESQEEDSDEEQPIVQEDGGGSLLEKMRQHKVLSMMLDFCLPCSRCIPDKKQDHEKTEPEPKGKFALFQTFCFQSVDQAEMEERVFAGWSPLPVKFEALSTSTLVLLFALIFHTDIVLDRESSIPTSTKEVCPDEVMYPKVEAFNYKLVNETNLAEATSQTEVTSLFLESLQNDTGSWDSCDGEDALIATREQFQNDGQYGKGAGLHFFPGACQAAQAMALEIARSQTCFEPKCLYRSIVDVDSIRGHNGKITGLDNFEEKIEATKNAVENLRPDCTNCDLGGGLGSLFGGTFDLYIEGQDEAQDAIDRLEDVEFGITDASATFSNVTKKFCQVYEIPCPDFSRYDELNEVVEDYKLVQLSEFAEREIDLDFAPPNATPNNDPPAKLYFELFESMLGKAKVASYLYPAYICLGLFFPAPMFIYKGNFWNSILRFLFGFSRNAFVAIVLIVWIWIVPFLQSELWSIDGINLDVALQVYLKDPCVARDDYAHSIVGNYSAVCSTLLSAQSEWKDSRETGLHVMTMVGAMNECCGSCPFDSLNQPLFTSRDTSHKDVMASYGFVFSETAGNLFGSGASSHLLVEEPFKFIGNLQPCLDEEYVRRETLKLTESSKANWFDNWIRSGLLSSLLLLTGVASFGVALVELAHPLSSCGGKYELPPEISEFEPKLKEHAKQVASDVRLAALGRVCIWGFLLNAMIINISLSKFAPADSKIDAGNGAILMVTSGVVVAAGYCFRRAYTNAE